MGRRDLAAGRGDFGARPFGPRIAVTTSSGVPGPHAPTHEAGGLDPVDLGLLAGELTDLQHGDRGGGSLHELATDLVPGFMSPEDKGKSDTISVYALSRMSFTFGDTTGHGVSKTGTGYATRRYFRFAGTDELQRLTLFCKIIAYKASGPPVGQGKVRIYDETNGKVIAEQTGIVAPSHTFYSPVCSNLPTGEALFRLDLDGGTGSTVECDALELY